MGSPAANSVASEDIPAEDVNNAAVRDTTCEHTSDESDKKEPEPQSSLHASTHRLKAQPPLFGPASTSSVQGSDAALSSDEVMPVSFRPTTASRKRKRTIQQSTSSADEYSSNGKEEVPRKRRRAFIRCTVSPDVERSRSIRHAKQSSAVTIRSSEDYSSDIEETVQTEPQFPTPSFKRAAPSTQDDLPDTSISTLHVKSGLNKLAKGQIPSEASTPVTAASSTRDATSSRKAQSRSSLAPKESIPAPNTVRLKTSLRFASRQACIDAMNMAIPEDESWEWDVDSSDDDLLLGWCSHAGQFAGSCGAQYEARGDSEGNW